MAAPTVSAVGTQAESNGDSNTLAVPYPSVAADDVMVAMVTNQRGESWDVSPANGFTLVAQTGGTAMYWKLANGSETGSTNFTKSGTTGELTGGMIAVRGADPVSPLRVSNSAGSLTVSTITTVADSLFVLYAGVIDSFATFSSYAMATDNPTWTERFDWGRAGQIASACATAPRSALTATGDITATSSAGSTKRMVVAAFKPAGAPIATLSSSTNSANANTVTVTKPSGTSDGDYLVATCGTRNGTCSAPAGWTSVGEVTYDSNRSTIFYRIASSEGASYIFTNNGGASGIAVGITTITGAATGTAPTYAGQANTASTTCTAPTITPAANSLIMLVCSVNGFATGISAQAIATSDPGLTEQYETHAPNNGGDGVSTVLATGVRSQSTATGSGTATISASEASGGQLVSIAPLATYTLTAATGAFTLTGGDAALSRIYKIVCGTGSFTLTGVSATLKWFSWIARTRPTSTWTDTNRSDQV